MVSYFVSIITNYVKFIETIKEHNIGIDFKDLKDNDSIWNVYGFDYKLEYNI